MTINLPASNMTPHNIMIHSLVAKEGSHLGLMEPPGLVWFPR